MKITQAYQPRPIRFLEIHQEDDWNVKLYSISSENEFVSNDNISLVKKRIGEWLSKSNLHHFETYKIATLIIHESREGCLAIINWWVGENMLQNFVYLMENENSYKLFSDSGITTCVWEMAVWWHERNAWVKHILMKNDEPDFDAYLNEQLNADI